MSTVRPESFRIVVPSAEQLDRLPDIERRAATVFSVADLPLALRVNVVPAAVLRTALASNLLRVAVDVEGVLGFALLERHEDAMHLVEASVAPEFARRGIGGALVSAMLDVARGAGASRVTLTTFDHVAWNRPFYERYGFRTVSTEDQSTRLRDVLAHERSAGLSRRVAMQWKERSTSIDRA